MKKKSIVVFFSVLLVGMRIYAIAPVTVGAVVAIVTAVTEVYKTVPNASYTVYVYGRGTPEMLTYDSADIALGAKDLALYKGAEKVVIKSKYYTIHSGCNGTYYPDGTYQPN